MKVKPSYPCVICGDSIMLDRLEGQHVGDFVLHIERRRTRIVNHWNVNIHLKDEANRISKTPIFQGIYSAGNPRMNIAGWFDGSYHDQVPVNDELIILSQRRLSAIFFQKIGAVIPPGGSLMVAYVMFHGESFLHQETALALQRGVPPLLTPLGFLLFQAGCRKIKDWYIAEGGREGPQKLWGLKSQSPQQEKAWSMELADELQYFIHIAREELDVSITPALSVAQTVLSQLRHENFHHP